MTWLSVLNAGWFGALLGVAGIIIGVWLHYSGKSFTRLRRVIASTSIVSPKPANLASQLSVLFAGAPVPRVTSTTLALWNDGKTTVRGADIVPGDPLRLAADNGVQILQTSVSAMSRPVIAVSTSHDGQSAFVQFSFLDPGDAFRIQVLHTGELGSLSLRGTIIGLPEGIKPPSPGTGSALVSFFSFAIGSMMIVATGLAVIHFLANAGWRGWWSVGLMVAASAALVGFTVFLEKRQRKAKVSGVPQVITDDNVIYVSLARPLG